PLPLRRPSPPCPREPRLASSDRRVQTNGRSAQAAHRGPPVLDRADPGLGRVGAVPRVRDSRDGAALAAASIPRVLGKLSARPEVGRPPVNTAIVARRTPPLDTLSSIRSESHHARGHRGSIRAFPEEATASRA